VRLIPRRYLNPKRWLKAAARVIPGAAGRRNRWAIQELAGRVSVLEKRLAAATPAIAQASARRSDLQAAHQVAARRYRQFLDQELMSAVSDIWKLTDLERGTEQSRRRAEIARDISFCLFALPVVAEETARRLLRIPEGARSAIIANLAAVASQLRADASSLTASPWHFAFMADAHVDSHYQESWRECDPDAPVRWVVTPAYVVDGQAIIRQRVYTHR
jgi:hypothetical protein